MPQHNKRETKKEKEKSHSPDVTDDVAGVCDAAAQKERQKKKSTDLMSRMASRESVMPPVLPMPPSRSGASSTCIEYDRTYHRFTTYTLSLY